MRNIKASGISAAYTGLAELDSTHLFDSWNQPRTAVN